MTSNINRYFFVFSKHIAVCLWIRNIQSEIKAELVAHAWHPDCFNDNLLYFLRYWLWLVFSSWNVINLQRFSFETSGETKLIWNWLSQFTWKMTIEWSLVAEMTFWGHWRSSAMSLVSMFLFHIFSKMAQNFHVIIFKSCDLDLSLFIPRNKGIHC